MSRAAHGPGAHLPFERTRDERASDERAHQSGMYQCRAVVLSPQSATGDRTSSVETPVASGDAISPAACDNHPLARACGDS
jgi:hypothetical protein